MKGSYKSALAFIFTIASFAFLSQSVYALIPIPVSKFKLDPKVISCAIISQNIGKKVDAFEASNTSHMEVYTKLSDRIELMIEKWKGWGYDTGDIEDGLDTLDGMIKEYDDDFNDLMTKLGDVKNACGTTDFDAKVIKAKEVLKEVRKDVVGIRVFYQTELRKDIVDLKGQTIK